MFKKNKYSKKELKKVKPILDKVENLKDQMRALSDEELKNLTLFNCACLQEKH